jgi:hypothetical protein
MAQARPSDDKDKSKKQSRSIAPAKRAPTKAGGRSSNTAITWGIVGVVLVVVIALVIYSITSGGGGSTTGGNAYESAPAALVKQVASIKPSVFNAVGVTSSAVPVTPPTATTGQSLLTFPAASGAKLPGVFYYGAEYCPFCAAERWAVTAALGRFGTISGLGLTTSSSTDVYPNTPSFSFAKASFSMQNLAVRAIERYSNIPLSDGSGGYTSLEVPNAEEGALVQKYDTTTFVPNTQTGSIPFISIGNQFLVSGASFSPSIFNGLSRQQIADGLNDPSNPVTQAIVSTANYITASICKVNGGQPGSVCKSAGVQAAAKAMKISL